MGLLWTLMGSSYTYNLFTGAGEILGGVLLFFPKLTTLGALITMGVMSHVTALNFGYDVPVKLFSAHLVLQSFFLAAADTSRLARFFVFNQSAGPSRLPQLFGRRSLRYAAVTLRVLVLAYALQTSLSMAVEQRGFYRSRVNPPLRGIYDVEEFARNGQSVPALLGDSTRWRRVIFAVEGALMVRTMEDRAQIIYRLQTDTVNQTLTLAAFPDTTTKTLFRYERSGPDNLVLSGRIANDSITARLKRFDDLSFLLTSRGFHWINETPFNR